MKKSNRKEEVIAFINQYITSNGLTAGDALPTQLEMVKTLNISRTTVREAVIELEGKGKIKVVNGRGMFVSEEKTPHLLSGLALEKKKESLIEILEARWALETKMIKNIISDSPREALEAVAPIVTELMAKYEDNVIQNDVDKRFHYALYNLCTNGVIKELMLSLSCLMDELWAFPLGIDSPFTDTLPYHQKMFEALLNRDVLKAVHYNDEIFYRMIEEIKSFKRMA